MRNQGGMGGGRRNMNMQEGRGRPGQFSGPSRGGDNMRGGDNRHRGGQPQHHSNQRRNDGRNDSGPDRRMGGRPGMPEMRPSAGMASASGAGGAASSAASGANNPLMSGILPTPTSSQTDGDKPALKSRDLGARW